MRWLGRRGVAHCVTQSLLTLLLSVAWILQDLPDIAATDKRERSVIFVTTSLLRVMPVTRTQLPTHHPVMLTGGAGVGGGQGQGRWSALTTKINGRAKNCEKKKGKFFSRCKNQWQAVDGCWRMLPQRIGNKLKQWTTMADNGPHGNNCFPILAKPPVGHADRQTRSCPVQETRTPSITTMYWLMPEHTHCAAQRTIDTTPAISPCPPPPPLPHPHPHPKRDRVQIQLICSTSATIENGILRIIPYSDVHDGDPRQTITVR